MGLWGAITGQSSYQVDPNAFNLQDPKDVAAQQAALAQARQGAPQVQGATINQQPYSQDRSQQQGLAQLLQAQANGTAPSAAEMQMQQGMQQQVQAQRAQAASARGGNATLAGRTAANNIAMGQQNTNANAAQMRAQEQASGQQALGGVLSGMAGQDVGLATSQAQLGQQANLANQQSYYQGLQAQQGLIGQGMTFAQQQQQALANQQALQSGQAQSNASAQGNFIGGLVSGGAALGAAGIMSDVVSKTNIAPGEPDTRKLFESMTPYTYDYKAGEGEPGRNAGIMAQDAQASGSPLADALVKRGEDGKLQIDGTKALTALLAGVTDLHHRMAAMESGNVWQGTGAGPTGSLEGPFKPASPAAYPQIDPSRFVPPSGPARGIPYDAGENQARFPQPSGPARDPQFAAGQDQRPTFAQMISQQMAQR
jgi:Chaperone of endosialidase